VSRLFRIFKAFEYVIWRSDLPSAVAAGLLEVLRAQERNRWVIGRREARRASGGPVPWGRSYLTWIVVPTGSQGQSEADITMTWRGVTGVGLVLVSEPHEMG
jgi:hypothetical protein